MWRGGPGTSWARKKPVTFEEADIDHSVQGWKLAEEHTMRVAFTEEDKSEVVLVVVDESAWARARQNPTRRDRKGVHRLVAPADARGTNPAKRPYPLLDEQPITQQLLAAKEPPEWLVRQV